MGLIADKLPALLRERFPQLTLTTPDGPDVFLTIEGPHGIGTISISDDGHEATVFLGDLTHGHFSVYERASSPEDVARQVCEQVLDFIDALTGDRLIVWGSRGGGGWRYLESGGPRDLPTNARAFLWSGPIR